MPQSESINELATALSLAQGEMGHAKKDSNNPFFKSKYADLASVLDVVRPVLSKQGLSLMCLPVEAEGNKVVLDIVLMHKSGQWASGRLAMQPVDNKPQSVGSCISYAIRYGVRCLLVVAGDDDDGAAASGTVGEKPKLERPVSSGMPAPMKPIIHAAGPVPPTNPNGGA